MDDEELKKTILPFRQRDSMALTHHFRLAEVHTSISESKSLQGRAIHHVTAIAEKIGDRSNESCIVFHQEHPVTHGTDRRSRLRNASSPVTFFNERIRTRCV